MSGQSAVAGENVEPQTQRLPVATHAAALAVEIRSPLSQIELAASQLFREALTPNARVQSGQIFDAVAEIDELVERMLRVLLPPRRSLEPVGDLAPMLADLRRRFVPALAACGVEWCTPKVGGAPVFGELNCARRQFTELLHLALILCGEGGQFSLDVAGGDEHVAASLSCRRASEFSEAELESARVCIQQSQAAALEGGAELSGIVSISTSEMLLRLSVQPPARSSVPTPQDALANLEVACLES